MTDDLIDRFYTAFANQDAETMASCYSDDIVFEDPAFGELHGDDARDMWRMLCGRATDLSVTHIVLEAGDSLGYRYTSAAFFSHPIGVEPTTLGFGNLRSTS